MLAVPRKIDMREFCYFNIKMTIDFGNRRHRIPRLLAYVQNFCIKEAFVLKNFLFNRAITKILRATEISQRFFRIWNT